MGLAWAKAVIASSTSLGAIPAELLVFILCGTIFYGTVAKIIFQVFNIYSA
jgi:hypothetical protein